jgi:hypothetical protein
VRERFVAAARAHRAGDGAAASTLVEQLAGEPVRDVALVVAEDLEARLAEVWERGWQPRELAATADRHGARAERQLVRWAMASQATGYAALGTRFAPRWMAQLQEVAAVGGWDPRRPYPAQLACPWIDAVGAAVRVAALLAGLRPLPRLDDPPSCWGARPGPDPGELPDGLLRKIRALLAKAESTPFAAEAESFTAKAQELMARHRIDRSMLAARGAAGGAGRPVDEPSGRRLAVDDPYADAKALLLAGIADANGCRAVWSKGLGFSTVFGFRDELDGVEELHTSLLVQATAALQREGPKFDHWGRSRTTRFRRSFLVAFAVRIGDRLQRTVAEAVDTATHEIGTAVVPFLAARTEAAHAAAERAFTDLRTSSPTATDDEGWFAGRVFADMCDVTLADELARPA